ncbi:MAG: hydroxymethylbilane synthase [Flavobacteriaceae bacterium]
MSAALRIGTRDSTLALWQAEKVKRELESHGTSCEIVTIKSEGDLNLSTPIYQMGLTGVFTKTLDAALLSDRIDLAVHSLKDVPTLLAEGLSLAATLKRANPKDVLVKGSDPNSNTIATGSLRRKAQWLNRFATDQVIGLRGNVQTRLSKIAEQHIKGGIFAAAGLERLGIDTSAVEHLDWMIPAPAQGAITIATRQDDERVISVCTPLNDENTALAVTLEREFLRRLEGGCSSPIGAYASIENDMLYFKGGLFSLDGSEAIVVERNMPKAAAIEQIDALVQEVLENGGRAVLKKIRDGQDS